MLKVLQVVAAVTLLLFPDFAGFTMNPRQRDLKNRVILKTGGIRQGMSTYSQVSPGRNLFGQPAAFPACMVKEVSWEGTPTKSTFFYNDKKQLIKHTESDGNVSTNIEYNSKGRISRVTGLETIKEMILEYDQDDKVTTVHVTKDGGSDHVAVKYDGDKIIKVEYPEFSISYHFDVNYNLVRAVSEAKDSIKKTGVEASVEVAKNYKNYLLSTGDYRFISLLYGDYIQEGAYTAAGTDFYGKYTTTDHSSGVAKTDAYATEVKSANEQNFPTSVLFRFNNADDNFRINISYDCK